MIRMCDSHLIQCPIIAYHPHVQFLFLKNKTGAPYGDVDGRMSPLLNKDCSCLFNSTSSSFESRIAGLTVGGSSLDFKIQNALWREFFFEFVSEYIIILTKKVQKVLLRLHFAQLWAYKNRKQLIFFPYQSVHTFRRDFLECHIPFLSDRSIIASNSPFSPVIHWLRIHIIGHLYNVHMTDVAVTGLIVMPHWMADFLDMKR